MLFQNLGIAIWVAMTGLSFILTRIPFSWIVWLASVKTMLLALAILYFGALCQLFRGG